MDNRDRNEKRPTWNAALIRGHATLGGETSPRLAALYTFGFVIFVGVIYALVKIVF